jgi:hypothetical protein
MEPLGITSRRLTVMISENTSNSLRRRDLGGFTRGGVLASSLCQLAY